MKKLIIDHLTKEPMEEKILWQRMIFVKYLIVQLLLPHKIFFEKQNMISNYFGLVDHLIQLNLQPQIQIP